MSSIEPTATWADLPAPDGFGYTREHSKRHPMRRLAERYGAVITLREFENMSRQAAGRRKIDDPDYSVILHGVPVFVGPARRNADYVRIFWRGHVLDCVVSKCGRRGRRIATFLPPGTFEAKPWLWKAPKTFIANTPMDEGRR